MRVTPLKGELNLSNSTSRMVSKVVGYASLTWGKLLNKWPQNLLEALHRMKITPSKAGNPAEGTYYKKSTRHPSPVLHGSIGGP